MPTWKKATDSGDGRSFSAPLMRRGSSTPTVLPVSKQSTAGNGIAWPTNGRKGFATCAGSSSARVTPACPMAGCRTAIDSAGGWLSSGPRTRVGNSGADRVTRLEALSGWIWDVMAGQWEEGFRHLHRFVEREDHARVAPLHVEEGYRLGQWVHKQRAAHAKRQLEFDRVARLEAVDGWTWDPFADRWEEGLGYLCRFVEREGHARVPFVHLEDGYQLGRWVTKRRAACAKGKLDSHRVARLEALPGWIWHTQADMWEEGFRYLCRFVEHEGHARVPNGSVEDGYRLGGWVEVQRRTYKIGKLDADRVARLESVPGWSWDKRKEEHRTSSTTKARLRSRPRAS